MKHDPNHRRQAVPQGDTAIQQSIAAEEVTYDTTPKRLRWKWDGDTSGSVELHSKSNVTDAHYSIDDDSGPCTAYYQGDFLAQGTLTEMFHACQKHDDEKL